MIVTIREKVVTVSGSTMHGITLGMSSYDYWAVGTSMDRNFDWKRPKMEHFVTIFGDAIMLASLK